MCPGSQGRWEHLHENTATAVTIAHFCQLKSPSSCYFPGWEGVGIYIDWCIKDTNKHQDLRITPYISYAHGSKN